MTDDVDVIQCALSDLLSSVAEAVREYAVGGTTGFVAYSVMDVRQKVERLERLVGTVDPETGRITR